MQPTLKVTGLRDLLSRMERIAGAPATEQALGRALRAGGWVIAHEARSIVHRRSGDLARSIGVGRVGRSESDVQVQYGRANMAVGPRAPRGYYGVFEEFGTNDTDAHPFMRPALDAKSGEAIDAVKSSLLAAIEEAARR